MPTSDIVMQMTGSGNYMPTWLWVVFLLLSIFFLVSSIGNSKWGIVTSGFAMLFSLVTTATGFVVGELDGQGLVHISSYAQDLGILGVVLLIVSVVFFLVHGFASTSPEGIKNPKGGM